MKLFEHLDMAQDAINRVDEGGLRDITKLAKQYKTATGYFHMDLDGVTSAIAMKAYLESYGIKTQKVIPINYGSSEFKAERAPLGQLIWMVDFAHGKPFLNIHTDHHDAQAGVAAGSSTKFVHAASNLEDISTEISPKDLFPPKDVQVISMVDSADFARNGITPDQVMNAAFGYDKTLTVGRNHQMMGLVVNKLLLANKGKKEFLEKLVMGAKPSLISMYNTITKLAKDFGYKAPAEVGVGVKGYVQAQKEKMKGVKVNPNQLKNGESTVWGTTIVQYGGGYMIKGYDRYTPFKLYPEAQYIVIGWPMGLVQVSKNPFLSGKNPIDLGNMVMKKILSKWKSKLDKEISLADIKRGFEMDIKPEDAKAMGFGWNDLISLFDPSKVKGVDLSSEGGWTKFIHSIADVKFSQLTPKQLTSMKKITINLWDIIQAQSGGHHDITNLQGLSFYGKGYVDDIMKPIMADIATEMSDKVLQ